MAVTKIKPIRGTVNKALAYILDPQKTDDAFYVSSYGCAASDAAAKEFEWTRNLAVQQGMQMPKVLARHLIQSFDIGEVTPEEAHEVGKQLADEWLKGKYEYVIATHIDKGLFESISFCDSDAASRSSVSLSLLKSSWLFRSCSAIVASTLEVSSFRVRLVASSRLSSMISWLFSETIS